MANFIVSQEAEVNTLNLLIAQLLAPSYMHLLGAATTIDPSTTLSTLLAAESTFPGYAAAALGTWSTPVIDGSGAAASTCATGTFYNTGGVSYPTYGLFVTDYGATQLWGCEAFSSPVMIAPGLGFNNTITYTCLSRY